MKHFKKYIAFICALCLMLGAFSGCGQQQTDEAMYDSANEMTNVDSGVVAENELYTMNWNQPRAAVIITSKKTGQVWATTPVDYLNRTTIEDFLGNELINSSLSINCKNAEQEFDYYASISCVQNGRFSSAKTDNGIEITYYFDDIQVYLSAEFYLEGDAFKVRVDPNKIKCFGEDIVASVVPAPFFCSTPNTAAGDKNSYMVVPSGSGALMYTDRRSDDSIRNFNGDIYGADLAIEKYEETYNETPVTMPFYGIKRNNEALCAILENGADACKLNVKTGDPQIGYSYINASYNVVGSNHIFMSGSHRIQVSSNIETGIEPLVIGYYPLTGSNANYTGIAKQYKKYLTEKEGLQKSQDNALLSVKLIGSYLQDDLFLGFPTDKPVALTSYKQAQEILGELSTISGGSVVADMYGYGKGGINGTQLAGGFSLTGVAGGKKALNEFVSYTADASIKTFFSFNTVTFATNTKGYHTNKSAAKAINGTPGTYRQYWYSTRARRNQNEGGVVYTLLSRWKLKEAVQKTVDLADKYKITGLAYDALSNMSYSDYSKNKEGTNRAAKTGMAKDVSEAFAEVKANSKMVMADGPFAYAAVAADVLIECPTASNQNFSFDADIPLYQIVFQGVRANSGSAINTAANPRRQFLKAIETGSGLNFILTGNYDGALRKQYMRGLNAALYSDNKEAITAYVNESKQYLASVAGASIQTHQLLTRDVTKTVFDNGVTVYVNYGTKDYSGEAGIVKAQGFIVK